MTSATVATSGDVKEIAPAGAAGLRFTVASRPQRRFANTQTISLLTANSFSPIQLPATGFVRRLALDFTFTGTAASAGALVAGDGPWNLLAGITLTDATGQPIQQPISGFGQYLLNKYDASGSINTNRPNPWGNPHLGQEYNYAATSTAFAAKFRLWIDLEQDFNTGYGCIPNLDSNASLQLKIDGAAYSVAFTGTTVSIANLTVRVTQHYWAPVGAQVGGVPATTDPVGLGDYLETRIETQPVSAATENIINVNNRGGLIRSIILVSRAATVRTAPTAAANIGLLLDNNPIDEGVLIEEQFDRMRREFGYIGTDLTTAYTPLSAGVMPGIDRGVVCWNFDAESGGRDSWLNTRVGSLLQLKFTPGASATSVDIYTRLMQVKNPDVFFAPSALD